MDYCTICGRARHAPDIVCAGAEPARHPSTTSPVDQAVQVASQAEFDWQPVIPTIESDDGAAAFEQLTPCQQQTMRVAAERLHLAAIALECVVEEFVTVARDIGCVPLAIAVGGPIDQPLLDIEQQLVDLRHLVGTDGGACNQRDCINIGGPRGFFEAHVVDVYAFQDAARGLRNSQGYVGVYEAAEAYQQAVIDAYNRDPEERAA